MEGSSTFGHQDRDAAGPAWLAGGRLITREHIVIGIERSYDAPMLRFSGDKPGKLALEV